MTVGKIYAKISTELIKIQLKRPCRNTEEVCDTQTVCTYIVSVLSTFVNRLIGFLEEVTKLFKTFRQDVKATLKEKQLTYAQLGAKTSIAESTIKGFMCGASDSRRVAEKIANALDCVLQYKNNEYLLINKED